MVNQCQAARVGEPVDGVPLVIELAGPHAVPPRCNTAAIYLNGGGYGLRFRGMTATTGQAPLTARVPCPNTNNRASCRADNSAETTGHCGEGDAPTAGMASAMDTCALRQ